MAEVGPPRELMNAPSTETVTTRAPVQSRSNMPSFFETVLSQGLGAGILQAMHRRTGVDDMADYNARVKLAGAEFHDNWNAEMQLAQDEGDDINVRRLTMAKRYYDQGQRMLEAGNSNGVRFTDMAATIMLGAIEQDAQERDAQQATQRALVSSFAGGLRSQHAAQVEAFRDVHENTSKLLQLMADGADPNSPMVKSYVADILTVGINGAYKDAPDFLDAAAQGLGATGTIVGAIAGRGPAGAVIGGLLGEGGGALITAVKSKDFKWTAEDVNRFAMNQRAAAEQASNRQLALYGQQAAALDEWAHKTRTLPQGVSLGDYISGRVNTLEFPAAPSMSNRPPAEKPWYMPQRETPTTVLGGIKDYLKNVHGTGTWRPRPTN